MGTEKHGERAHAPYSPSSTERWMACPWAVNPNLPEPANRPTIYTEAGTAMHEVAEKHLLAWTDPKDTDTLTFLHPQTGKPVAIPPAEWLPQVRMYLGVIRNAYGTAEMLADEGQKPLLFVEERVTVLGTDCWGTLDCAVIAPKRYLRLADLKTGKGHLVPANSPQFLTYLVGLCEKYGWDWDQIECGPVQLAALDAEDVDEPGDPCPVYMPTIDELKAHFKAIKAAIKASKKAAADGSEPPPSCVGDHCHWCPRKVDWALNGAGEPCPAHRAAALSVLDDELNALDAKPVEPGSLAPAQRAFLLDKAPDIIKFLKALQASEIEAQAMGRGLPAWKVVEGRSNRKWDPALDPGAVAHSLTEIALLNEVAFDPWKRELVNITEVEKALGKGATKGLVIKPQGKPTLAPATDKRPAMTNIGTLEGILDDE